MAFAEALELASDGAPELAAAGVVVAGSTGFATSTAGVGAGVESGCVNAELIGFEDENWMPP